jgi:hypothetical protein
MNKKRNKYFFHAHHLGEVATGQLAHLFSRPSALLLIE